MNVSLGRLHPGRILTARPIRDYAFMTAGILLTAWALDSFLIPNRLAAGGVSGLATVLHYMAKGRGVTIPVGVLMLLMNVGLLAIGIRVRGWRYGAKTVYGAIGLSLAVDLLAPFTPNLVASDNLLAALYGGALTGIGMGMVFKSGGNTGGTDIVAQLLTPRISLGTGQILFAADALVTLAAAVVLGPTLALYGAVAVFVNGSVIDLVLEGVATEKAAFIVSRNSPEIGQAVLHELGRGATGISARGLYTGEEQEVVFTVVSRREVDDLKRLVNTLDPEALLIISDVHEAIGEGFKEYRAR